MRIGIFGGSFNPIHWGHLLIAEAALSQFSLDRVLWIPAYRPPHKTESLLTFRHRLEMVRQSVLDHPAFLVSDLEAQRPEVSYAIATLNALKQLYPAACWYWIVGMDAFASLPGWRSGVEVAAQCTWLVAPRSLRNSGTTGANRFLSEELGQQVAAQLAAQSVQLRWYSLQMPSIEISSSLVRHYCQEGRSIRYLVPESVRQYISAEKLYQIS